MPEVARGIEVGQTKPGTFIVQVVAEGNHLIDQLKDVDIRTGANPVVGMAAKLPNFPQFLSWRDLPVAKKGIMWSVVFNSTWPACGIMVAVS